VLYSGSYVPLLARRAYWSGSKIEPVLPRFFSPSTIALPRASRCRIYGLQEHCSTRCDSRCRRSIPRLRSCLPSLGIPAERSGLTSAEVCRAVFAAPRTDNLAVERHPRLPGAHDGAFGGPDGEYWQVREWLSWEADHITAVARVRHSARFRKMHEEVIAEFRPRAEAALSFVNKTVKERPFLVGDKCTIADIGCWGRMVFMAEGGFEIGRWPHLEAWAARIKAMPGFLLPYDLIPSKDREFPAAPHYSPP
jgi:Glutathione S-transferase, C-terminal domain